MCDKAPSISPGQRICDSCRKELAKIPLPDPMPHPTPDPTPCDSVSESDSETECTGTISPPSTEALQVESSESLTAKESREATMKLSLTPQLLFV